MSIEIGIVFTAISLIIAVSSFIVSLKKNNKTDGFELGSFIGEMRTEISSIKTMITEIKADNKDTDKKIQEAIYRHEKTFHNKGD